eukprot:TRINITY_DN7168_c0_g1_i1.p1 TRINITY_DN7168_c0_g1~~TRINITY_DN7168_c0_g1_i1.p1  ORF type:complete len:1352 (+),score=396.81 TRINITY_DN7168_c0_g1_i1:91-4056(+)
MSAVDPDVAAADTEVQVVLPPMSDSGGDGPPPDTQGSAAGSVTSLTPTNEQGSSQKGGRRRKRPAAADGGSAGGAREGQCSCSCAAEVAGLREELKHMHASIRGDLESKFSALRCAIEIAQPHPTDDGIGLPAHTGMSPNTRRRKRHFPDVSKLRSTTSTADAGHLSVQVPASPAFRRESGGPEQTPRSAGHLGGEPGRLAFNTPSPETRRHLVADTPTCDDHHSAAPTGDGKSMMEALPPASSLPAETVELLRELYRKLDTDGSGAIDLWELRKVLPAAFHGPETDAQLISIVSESVGKEMTDDSTLTFFEFARFFEQITTRNKALDVSHLNIVDQLGVAMTDAVSKSRNMNVLISETDLAQSSDGRALRPDTPLRWALQGVLCMTVMGDLIDNGLSASGRGYYDGRTELWGDWLGPFAVAWGLTGFIMYVTEAFLTSRTLIRKGRWKLCEDPAEVQNAYIRGKWLPFDIVASLPLDLIGAATGSLLALRIVRTLKLLRIARVPTFFRVTSPIRARPKPIQFFLFAWWTSMGVFTYASLWLLVSTSDISSIEAEEPAKEVARAVYFVLTTVTTVGYGDVSPVTTIQMVITLLIQCSGVAWMVCVGAVSTAFVIEADPQTMAMRDRIRNMSAMVEQLQIPWSMQQRCFSILPSIVEAACSYRDLLDDMPPFMRDQIESFAKLRLLRQMPLFAGADTSALLDLVVSMRKVVAAPSDYIIRQGEPGADLFIILHGCVEVTVPDNDRGGVETWVATLGEGSWFGENALLFDVLRTANVRAIPACELFVLDKISFLRTAAANPAFEAQIRLELEKRTGSENQKELAEQGKKERKKDRNPLKAKRVFDGATTPTVDEDDKMSDTSSMQSGTRKRIGAFDTDGAKLAIKDLAACWSAQAAYKQAASAGPTRKAPVRVQEEEDEAETRMFVGLLHALAAAGNAQAVRATFTRMAACGATPSTTLTTEVIEALINVGRPAEAVATAKHLISLRMPQGAWLESAIAAASSYAEAVALLPPNVPLTAGRAAALLRACANGREEGSVSVVLAEAEAAGVADAMEVQCGLCIVYGALGDLKQLDRLYVRAKQASAAVPVALAASVLEGLVRILQDPKRQSMCWFDLRKGGSLRRKKHKVGDFDWGLIAELACMAAGDALAARIRRGSMRFAAGGFCRDAPGADNPGWPGTPELLPGDEKSGDHKRALQAGQAILETLSEPDVAVQERVAAVLPELRRHVGMTAEAAQEDADTTATPTVEGVDEASVLAQLETAVAKVERRQTLKHAHNAASALGASASRRRTSSLNAGDGESLGVLQQPSGSNLGRRVSGVSN